MPKKMPNVSYLNRTDLSRGIRNNNPGNLVVTENAWQGKIQLSLNTDKGKKFEQFESMSYGVRAMLRNLVNHIDKGENTIRKLITTYAPPSENDTQEYIKQVAKAVGLSPDSIIKSVDSTLLFLLAKAIVSKENGKDAKYVTDSDIKTAIANLGTFNTSNIVVNTAGKINFAVVLGLLLFLYTVLIVTV